jgi:hypothetical protein
MEEAIKEYGITGLADLLDMTPFLHLFMTTVTSFIFLPINKNLPRSKEMIIILYNALFWAFILFMYQKFVVADEMDILRTVNGVVGTFISLLLSYVFTCLFHLKFRVRIFNRRKK